MPQITSITSEALQATIRRLLPSQQGFGDDLQATNLITPVIDLTSSAEGSEFRQDLQTAMAFGSQTVFSLSQTTSTILDTPGFWRVTGVVNIYEIGGPQGLEIYLTDGSTDKLIYKFDSITANVSRHSLTQQFDQVFFLAAGEGIKCTVTQYASFVGSYRQIANVNGEFVNPSGFNPQ